MAQRQTTSVPLRTLSLGLALSVFLADLMLPVGVVASIPYIAVVLLAARSAWRGYPVMVALGCTGLTILGWVYALPGSFVWMDITNRGLVMSAIWVVVSLVRQHLPGSTSSSPTLHHAGDDRRYARARTAADPARSADHPVQRL